MGRSSVSEPVVDLDEVYVYVKAKVLWPDGNGGRGMWLTPGSAHPMSAGDADSFALAHPDELDRIEKAVEHHRASAGGGA